MATVAHNFSPVDVAARKAWPIRPGSTVKVWLKVQEKKRTRLQAFEGLVIARKHGTEPGATFTVRKVASGVGMEKIFPLYSPVIDKVEVLRTGAVRRSKLYYIRRSTAKETRAKMRQSLHRVSLRDEAPAEAAVEQGAEESVTVE